MGTPEGWIRCLYLFNKANELPYPGTLLESVFLFVQDRLVTVEQNKMLAGVVAGCGNNKLAVEVAEKALNSLRPESVEPKEDRTDKIKEQLEKMSNLVLRVESM